MEIAERPAESILKHPLHAGDAQVIWLHWQAPPKPVAGQTCNGCGVCCATEPCPVASVFLWQYRGSCRALIWAPDAGRYLCGMLTQPARYLRWLPQRGEAWFSRRVARWIAAETVCDSTVSAELQAEPASSQAQNFPK